MSSVTSLLVTGDSKPEEVLNLPKGRLKIGEFVVDFSPEQAYGFAQAIIEHFERAEGNDVQRLFFSQAGVIEYFAHEIGLSDPLQVKAF